MTDETGAQSAPPQWWSWESSNPAVIEVDFFGSVTTYVVYAKAPGTTTISVFNHPTGTDDPSLGAHKVIVVK